MNTLMPTVYAYIAGYHSKDSESYRSINMTEYWQNDSHFSWDGSKPFLPMHALDQEVKRC